MMMINGGGDRCGSGDGVIMKVMAVIVTDDVSDTLMVMIMVVLVAM